MTPTTARPGPLLVTMGKSAAILFTAVFLGAAAHKCSAQSNRAAATAPVVDEHALHCYIIASNCIDALSVLGPKAPPEDTMALIAFCAQEWTEHQCAKLINTYRAREKEI